MTENAEAVSLKEARKRPATHRMHAQDTWDNYSKEEINSKPWVRPTSLAAPKPRPGFVQRWIRVATHGVEDPANTMRKFREGWKPRPAETIPADFPVPTIAHGEWAGCIGIEGSILCEMPQELAAKRNAHYHDKANAVDAAIEAELQKESSSRMPITQQRSSQSRLVRTVRAADNE